jgi:hypothetical protein
MPRTRRAVLTAVVSALAAACGRRSSDPVRAMVDDLVDAAEARDADAVLARLSAGFQAQVNLSKPDVAASLRRYFAAYESIDLEVFDVVSEPGDTGASHVRVRVGFKGTAQKAFGLEGLLPPSAVYAFDLDTRDEGGEWRVIRASWEVLPGPGSTEAR